MLVSVEFVPTTTQSRHWRRGPMDHPEMVSAILACKYAHLSGTVSVDISDLSHWQKTNLVSLVHKCVKHLCYIARREAVQLPNDHRGRPSKPRAWKTYSEENEAESLQRLADYCQENLVGIKLTVGPECETITFDLLSDVPRKVAAAFVYRVANMVRWSFQSPLKLSSKSYMTWDTFERVTKRLDALRAEAYSAENETVQTAEEQE